MKKSLLVICIIFVSVVCTACVNRFAVQELNNNAKELLSKGQPEAAISRLESSIDLDENVFETHYNLAVAYIEVKKYDKALSELDKVKELKPDFADTYHSIAVVNEELAYAVITGENEEESTEDKQADNSDDQTELTNEEKAKVCEYFSTAIDNYNTYLTKNDNAADKEKVEQKISELNEKLKKYSDVNEEKAE